MLKVLALAAAATPTLAAQGASAQPAARAEGAAQDPVTASPTCNAPVYLVVWVDHLNRAKSKAYGEGLRRSHIAGHYGGKYVAVSPPLEVLEGDWPPDRGFVLEEYPCLEAVKKLWYSEEYQKQLKPLRADSGDYKVAVFKKWDRTPDVTSAPAAH